MKNSIFFHLIYFIIIYAFTLSIPKVSLFIFSYSILAVLNQALVITLILLLLLTPFIWLNKHIFRGLNALLFGSILLILIIDHTIYNLYRFHINGFFINMFFTDFQGFGFSMLTLVKISAISLFSLLGCYFVQPVIAPFIKKKTTVTLFVLSFIGLFLGQGIHAYSHAHNMSAILRFTPAIPWYTPLIAIDDLKKWGLINQHLIEDNLPITGDSSSNFNYPTAPLACSAAGENTPPNIILIAIESWRYDAMSKDITPNIANIAQNGLNFKQHLSAGNVTTKGLFSLFYGISPIYWNDAKAAQSEPAFISHLRQLDYDFSILANQDIERTELKSLFFSQLEAVQSHKNNNSLLGDKALVGSFKDFVKQSNKPFFSFLFFNSTHHSYYFPENEEKPFQPSEEIEMSVLNNQSDPQVYLNQYFNAAYKIDQYVKQIQDFLIEQNKWNNSIVIITGDHAEEFNEQKLNYWGHGSNFTKYQLQVPLVIHWPNKQLEVNYRTSHFDIFSTILKESFGCTNPISDHSSGYSLFDPTARTIIASSYVNNAIIDKNRVDEMIASYVSSYHFEDKNLPADDRSADLLKKSSHIMSQFK